MAPQTGYPTIIGDHKLSVFPHSGPSSYVRITFAPLANGDIVRVAEAGLKFFDKVENGVTDSGNFSVAAMPAAANPSTSKNGASGATYVLRWTALRTATIGGQSQTAGSEAAASTNLSAEVVRLSAFGRY